jgi:hypothetical protein
MIELAQHIEALLLDHDCVILPGIGGFITHYTPAEKDENLSVFLPPTRMIGFNPQLIMNDGLLTQSYMSVYQIGYPEASRRVERLINRLITTLHKEGSVQLPHIGEMLYDIHNAYNFAPYESKITTPYLYGLDAVEMPLLQAQHASPPQPVPLPDAKSFVEIKLSRTFLYRAAAVAVVALVLLFLPTPIEKNLSLHEDGAKLLPGELIEHIDRESLRINPIVVRPQTPPVAHVAPAEQPAPAQPAAVAKPYHIIIASMTTEKDVQEMVDNLLKEGFTDAKAIIGNGKMRVGLQSFPTQSDAYRALTDLRRTERFKNAWVLKKRLENTK